jgi:hypothetical protein
MPMAKATAMMNIPPSLRFREGWFRGGFGFSGSMEAKDHSKRKNSEENKLGTGRADTLFWSLSAE